MNDTDHGWRPRAIVFDLLTALLNSWDTWAQSTPTQSPEQGRVWRERYLDLTFGAGAYTPETSYETLVRKAAADVQLPRPAADELLRSWKNLAVWPEAPAVLRRLRSGGFKTAVVTNCSETLGQAAVRSVEESVGGGFRFDAAVTAEECGFYKPHAAAYGSVLAAVGVGAEDVLFVAGSAGDVQGATDADMKVVWHNRVGLGKRGGAIPLREGQTLTDALEEFL